MANRRFIDFPIAASVGDNDIVLIWQDGLNKQTTKSTLFAGSPSTLASLTDVDISALTNGQILQYNSTTSKWENVDRTDIDLDQLGDVTIVSPTNGQVLVYNSSTSKWENSSGGFVPYTGAVTTVNLGAQSILAGTFVKAGGTSAQFLKADGSVDSTAYGTGSVTSVGLTMPSAFNVASSPVTTNGTIAVTGAGTTAQYVRGDGSLASFPSLTGFVPYTGATADVDLGTHDLTAERGTFANNGSSDTLTVNHTSGSGYGIKVTKGGNNEALLVTKTSGSGNAMAVVGGRTALVDLSLSSVSNATGNFLTISGGVVHQRTPSETRSDVGAQAQLNGTGFVKANGTTISYDNSTYQVTSEKGQPNGYASLDGNGKVPLAQINDALIGNVNYQGLWNAATNNPTLVNPPSSGTKGYYYIVSTAGTFASISFEVGDWIISNGSAWQKVDNTDAVSSVFGRTGNVTATNGDYNTSQVTENTNLYYTEARVSSNTDVAANTAARHNAVTLGTANGLSLNTQQLSLALASAGVTGALSGTDWSTFNSKQQALNGTGFVKISGTTISYDNSTYLTTSAAASTYLPLAGGTMTGAINIVKDNDVLNITPVTSGGYSVVNFNSRVNLGSDKGFIVVQDESAFCEGSGNEDLRMSIGVFNDFRQSSTHSDELWLQGGGRLVYNVGSWDSELNTIIGTPGVGTTGGYEWRVNNSVVASLNPSGNLTAASIIRSGGTSSQFLKADGSIDSNAYITGNQTITLSGDATGSGTTAITVVLANSGVAAGTYNNSATQVRPFTVDAKGRITSIGTAVTITPAFSDVTGKPTTLAGYGITDAYTQTQVNTLLSGYLPLTGGTLTGQLIGTNARFVTSTLNSSFPALFLNEGTGSGTYGQISATDFYHGIILRGIPTNNTDFSVIGGDQMSFYEFGGDFRFYKKNGSTLQLQASIIEGAGNFISSLTATSFIRSGGTSSQFLKADGSVDSTAYGTGSVTSVAALTLGTSGTDLSSTVANGTTTPVITLNVPTASAANRGALSAADWTTFNGKENAITAGTTAQYYRGDKTFQTLNTAAVPELTNLYYTEARVSANTDVAANTAARHAAVTLGTANGLSLSTQQLSLGLASSSANGALSSTDWTTFNNKQNALTNPVTGTGTAGQVAYWSSGSAITGESNLFWDATNDRLGISNASPTDKLQMNGGKAIFATSNFNGTTAGGSVFVFSDDNNGGKIWAQKDGNQSWGYLSLQPLGGNVLIGTTSDNGAKFQVSGTSTFSNTITLNNDLLLTGTEKIRLTGAGVNNAFISESWGINLNGATTHPIQVRSASLSVGYVLGGGTAYGAGNLFVEGNTMLGTTTNAGFKLDVNGTGRFSGNGIGLVQFGGSSSGLVNSIIVNNTSNTTNSDAVLTAKVAGASGGNPHSRYEITGVTTWFAGVNNAASDSYVIAGDAGIGSGTYFSLSTAGAATFSSSVTATAGIFNLNTTDGGFKIVGVNATPNNLAYLANNYFPKFYTRNHNFGITIFDQDSNNVGIQAADLVNGTSAKALIFNPYGGNVGIGTASPSVALNVVGNARFEASSGNRYVEITSSTSSIQIGTDASTQFIYGVGNFPLTFSTNAAERMRITAGGNLLIGTTTDNGARLQVSGNGHFSQADANVYIQSTSGSGKNWQLQSFSDGNLYINVSGVFSALSLNGSTGAATFSSSVTAASFIPSGSTIPTNGMYLPSANTIAFSTNTTQRISVSSAGEVQLKQSSNSAQNSVIFNTTIQNAMTLNSSGFLILNGTTGSSRITCYGDGYFSGGIQTGNPYGSTSANWLLGRFLTETTSANGSIRVQIGSKYYNIAAEDLGEVPT